MIKSEEEYIEFKKLYEEKVEYLKSLENILIHWENTRPEYIEDLKNRLMPGYYTDEKGFVYKDENFNKGYYNERITKSRV